MVLIDLLNSLAYLKLQAEQVRYLPSERFDNVHLLYSVEIK